MPADVTDRGGPPRPSGSPPLKGIFHTAMVLEGPAARRPRPRHARSRAPPQGARRLEPAPRVARSGARPLRAVLVALERVRTCRPGQLRGQRGCRWARADRSALGLPATVVNWGHVGEVGYLAQRNELSAASSGRVCQLLAPPGDRLPRRRDLLARAAVERAADGLVAVARTRHHRQRPAQVRPSPPGHGGGGGGGP